MTVQSRIRGISAVAALAVATTLVGCSTGGSTAGPSDTPRSTDFPTKDVTLVIPFAAGGAVDALGREFAELLAAELGVGVQVENIPGGSATLGAAAVVVDGDEEGYDILFGSEDSMFLQTQINPDLPYTLEDVDLVASAYTSPSVIAVRSDAPWQNLEELLDASIAAPGTIRVAAAGEGSLRHATVEALNSDYGAALVPAFFAGGAAEGLTAVLAGEVEAQATEPGGVLGQVESGDIRVLGIGTDTVPKEFSGAQTYRDLGLNLTAKVSPGGIVIAAPIYIPAENRAVIADAVNAVIASTAWVEILAARSTTVVPASAAQQLFKDRAEGFKEIAPRIS